MSVPEATEERLVSLVDVWKAIEEVVPREKLASAVETVAAFVPVSDDDAAAQWRAELVKRYRTVQGFIDPLLSTIRFRAVKAGTPVLAMVRAAAVMAKSRRYAPGDIAAHDELTTGSWRPLVYRNATSTAAPMPPSSAPASTPRSRPSANPPLATWRDSHE